MATGHNWLMRGEESLGDAIFIDDLNTEGWQIQEEAFLELL